MTNKTVYKFAYYYTSGDGSNDSDSYTSYDEALKEFKLTSASCSIEY